MIISSDSLLAVQAVMKPSSDLNYVGLCALDILALSLDLEIKSIFHVKRTANIVAHFLANLLVYPLLLSIGQLGIIRLGWSNL